MASETITNTLFSDSDSGAIKILLLRHLQNLDVGCQFFRTYIRPVVAQFAQEPVGIGPSTLSTTCLNRFIQQNIGGFQTLLEAQMETGDSRCPSDNSFPCILSRCPTLLRYGTPQNALEEALHIGYLQNSVIEVLKRLVPCTGSPVFQLWKQSYPHQ
jgi:hypothetical protein